MTLNELFDRFLPDFHIRIATAKTEHREWTAEQEANFIANVFPEAMQNYTDKVCKKQRGICADIVAGFLKDQTKLTIMVADAEQPKIEEL